MNRYRNRFSAPILDRIDIQIELGRLEQHELLAGKKARQDTSEQVRVRVDAARRLQRERQDCLNARLGNRELERYCELDEGCQRILQSAIDKLRLTARSYHKLLKLGRTIADLAGEPNILQTHIAEAISYRSRGEFRP